MSKRWRCHSCHRYATGVNRSRADGFIYEAACDEHGADHAGMYFDRWGVVGEPTGPAGEGGVRFARTIQPRSGLMRFGGRA